MAGFGEDDAAALRGGGGGARPPTGAGWRRAKVRPERGYAEALAAFGGPLPEAGLPADRGGGGAGAAGRGRAARLRLAELPRLGDRGLASGGGGGGLADLGLGADGRLRRPDAGGGRGRGGGGGLAPRAARAAARRRASGFTTGATMANFTALAAARGALLRRAGWDVEARGLFGAPEVARGARRRGAFVGLPDAAAARLRGGAGACGGGGRRGADAAGRAGGGAGGLEGPAVVCLQAGNVVSGAFDPFAELIPLARAKGAWVHVDGAFGLWALAAPSLARLTAGLGEADSWAADGHKWLQVPYDCGFAIVRDSARAAAGDEHQRELPAERRESGAGGVLAGDVAAGARLRGLGGADGARAAGGRRDGRAALRGGAAHRRRCWRGSRGSRC